MTLDLLKVLAKAEPFNTDLKRRAATSKQMLKQGFQGQRSFDEPVDFFDFSTGQTLPARPHWHFIPQTIQEDFNLRERKAHAAGERDEHYPL
jgi:hypothetical protein